MKALRVGIVGCGRMGRERASACATLGHHVALVHDADPARALELQMSCPASQLAGTFLEEEWRTLDAVFLCTPPAGREQFVRSFLRIRVPFFVEKPVGVSADGGEPIVLELTRRPLVHAVGYMNRCRASVQHARAVLAGHRTLGIACHWLGNPYSVSWWLDTQLSGGPINEQATHLIDLCRFLLGEITRVQAVAAPARRDAIEFTAAVALSFAGGQVGTMLYSCGASEKQKQIGVRVLTTQGSLELSGWDLDFTAQLAGVAPASADTTPIFVLETARFLRAVEGNDPSGVACDYADALRTQGVVDAVRQSMRSGQPVRFGSAVGSRS